MNSPGQNLISHNHSTKAAENWELLLVGHLGESMASIFIPNPGENQFCSELCWCCSYHPVYQICLCLPLSAVFNTMLLSQLCSHP